MYSKVLNFLMFFKFFTVFLFSHSVVWILLLIELLLIKIFLYLVINLYLKFVIMFLFLMMAACGSVVGLSILMKMSRSKSSAFIHSIFD